MRTARCEPDAPGNWSARPPVRTRHRSSGTTSRRASLYRTPSSRASTAACGTSFSTRRCSRRSARPEQPWAGGGPATMDHARTLQSAGRPHPPSPPPSIRDGIRRCARSKAPRQIPPLTRPNRPNPPARTNVTLDKIWGQRHLALRDRILSTFMGRIVKFYADNSNSADAAIIPYRPSRAALPCTRSASL